jgi:hypothetical protein
MSLKTQDKTDGLLAFQSPRIRQTRKCYEEASVVIAEAISNAQVWTLVPEARPSPPGIDRSDVRATPQNDDEEEKTQSPWLTEYRLMGPLVNRHWRYFRLSRLVSG